ncbi:MAG: protein kinase/lanthionine synthetase C family protein [Chloroflexi bacterium AL-W]|nr:protein kinase/lanthionine synthetase C family protein [Chloroflexi bacterium AL-N1]NOK64762.1 protein kinase/lanthionine synthetase C family protein [Chloroflexi bacterium AL-N10]NOK76003.1 protein kinase/lanthionine synthetase C family protein [Chloroflexi bacterium AL-N5]NOK80238.1 protein kinase/lanthionine synthetase C family protein [Chloroflexi bacterium AL-W]NOK86751.1 protein kinase/lanthionine synthetase C family protein [Chloroflexi bacterium AL-N15]
MASLSFSGESPHVLIAPNGEQVQDVRAPMWSPPPWVTDPFETAEEPEDEEGEVPTLKEGRYQIEEAITFSVSGGVYVATDRTNNTRVLIKEARPATGCDQSGYDAVDRLRKEYRLLQKLQKYRIAPQPIDLFSDWEHLFLVEEYIDGIDLTMFVVGLSPIVQEIHPSSESKQHYLQQIYAIWQKLAFSLAQIHAEGIVCGDLSNKNVLVHPDNPTDVRIIDLETAWEVGVDTPVMLATPGFTVPQQGFTSDQAADIYALGSIMLSTLFPMNLVLDVDPSAKERFIKDLGADLGVSADIQQIIQHCMADEAAQRPPLEQVVMVLKQAVSSSHSEALDLRQRSSSHSQASDLMQLSSAQLYQTVDGLIDYILTSADFTRRDRLFPADPMIFTTNPLSVAFGASGVAHMLVHIRSEVPSSVRAWMLTHDISQDKYPAGLYMGLSGIAWVLWECGLEDMATQLLHKAGEHPLLFESADIFYGATGYGLTCLRFYLNTGDQSWLDRAMHIGEWLMQTCQEVEKGCCWPDQDGQIWLGYTRGGSGIALFLLYLYLASGRSQFLEIGEQALAFEVAHARKMQEGVLAVPRGILGSEDSERVSTHYWLDGSAGVATTLMRFWVVTQKQQYHDSFAQFARDSCRKYTAFPSLFRGLSGLGNVLLDAYEFTHADHYLHEAHRVANGVLLYKIDRPQGIAFPGEQLMRIATDFGTGSAGIALFLHRLGHAGERNGNFNFTLDQLLI